MRSKLNKLFAVLVSAGSLVLSYTTGVLADTSQVTNHALSPRLVHFDGDLVDLIPALYGGTSSFLPLISHNHDADHFQENLIHEFSGLVTSLNSIPMPMIIPHVGTRFDYDRISEQYTRISSFVSGSAYVADAETSGRGERNFGSIVSKARFDTLDGEPFSHIAIELEHVDLDGDGLGLPCIGGPAGACHEFERDIIHLDLNIDMSKTQTAFYGNYGVTDRLDVGVLVPWQQISLTVFSEIEIIPHDSVNNVANEIHEPSNTRSGLESSRSGVGDIWVHAKYWIKKSGRQKTNVAIDTGLRLPTGSPDDLSGNPNFGVRLQMLVSQEYKSKSTLVRPHMNIGFETNAGRNGEALANFYAGGSYLYEGLTWFNGNLRTIASLDFLGRKVIHGTKTDGSTFYDISLGAGLILGDSATVFYNILLPLNRDGTRPQRMNTVGFQYRF